MLEDLNRKLADLTARMEKAFDLEGRLERLESDQARIAGRVMKLKRKLAREDGDVERIEHPGFFGVFRFVFGGREKRLREEKREAYAARQRYEQASARLAPIEEEISKIRAELEGLSSLGEEYTAVMEQKEKAIYGLGGERASRLADLAKNEEGARSAHELLDECCDEAADASICLARASAALRDARTWGKADLVMGGSMYTWGAKHLAVNKAKNLVKNAQVSLRNLNRLVKDRSDGLRIPTVTMNSLLTITDLVLSNPIVDLVVLKRIGNSVRKLRKAHKELKRAMRALLNARDDVAAELNRISRERREFVETLT
jgi:chromosome segregation ATPase